MNPSQNSERTARHVLQFRFRSKVMIVGIVACLAMVLKSILVARDRAWGGVLGLEQAQLEMAWENKRKNDQTATFASPIGCDANENLVYQLSGAADGVIHYEFQPARLVDVDNDGFLEYLTVIPHLFHCLREGRTSRPTVWDSRNNKLLSSQDVDQLAWTSAESNPLVPLFGIYCFSFFLLPAKLRNAQNFGLGLLLIAMAMAILFAMS